MSARGGLATRTRNEGDSSERIGCWRARLPCSSCGPTARPLWRRPSVCASRSDAQGAMTLLPRSSCAVRALCVGIFTPAPWRLCAAGSRGSRSPPGGVAVLELLHRQADFVPYVRDVRRGPWPSPCAGDRDGEVRAPGAESAAAVSHPATGPIGTSRGIVKWRAYRRFWSGVGDTFRTSRGPRRPLLRLHSGALHRTLRPARGLRS